MTVESLPALMRQESPTKPRSATLVPLACLLVAVSGALFSTGFFDFDELLHFLHSQRAWQEPKILLSIWGRLGCTAFYALAAPLGITVTRLLAVVVTTITALGTVRLMHVFLPAAPTRNSSSFFRHRVAWVWILLFAQPCFVLNSFTVMSEMLLAALWVWTAVLLVENPQRTGKFMLTAFLLGLGGLMRPEGWIAVACWPVFAFFWLTPPHRLPKILASTLLAGLPSLAWYLAGAFAYANFLWIAKAWPWAPASPYGKTGLIFLLSLGLSVFFWMWIPILPAIRQHWQNRTAKFLLITPVLGMFAMHGLLGILGLMGSLSLPRYFISISPMLAILALLGLIYFEQRRPSFPRRLIITLSILPTLILALMGYLPTQKFLTHRRLDLACAQIAQQIPPAQRQQKIIAAHPYALYILNMPLDAPGDIRIYSTQQLAAATPGTLLIVDEKLWQGEGKPSPTTLGYVEDKELSAKTDAVQPRIPLTSLAFERSRISVWIKR